MGNTRPYRGTMLAHLALLMLLVSTVSSQSATVSFVESAITIQEGGAATVRVQKTGDSPGEVRVVVGFQDQMAANADFVGNNFVLSFPAGSATSVQEGTFYSSDDDNPEPDEPFSVTMTVISGGAVIGDPSTTTVTIAANDDAFGVIGFDVVSPMRVTEEQSSTTLLLPLKRERGTFGLVAVTYQITGGSGTASGDLTPVTGSVTISQGISTDALRIVILADLIPEDDEEFTVELTSVSGGATLNSSSQSVLLIINANDSPLRFAQPQYSFPENAGTVTVEVQRGLDTDGLTPLGPSDQTVTVEYWFYSGSAELGVDCVVTNGSLGFSPGEMTKTISIAILDDPTPELAEEFSISLANPSTNAVLVEPVTTVVAILPNDDQHGVLSLSSENSGSSPKAVINEDTTFSTSSFTVVREGGTFGEVSIDYIITRNDSSSAPIVADLAPASGTVTLPEGQRSQSIPINIIDDPVPEEAEQFIISLLPDSVTGGASVGAVTEGLLTIQDSDDAYGVIQFSSDVEQRIVSSTRPRQLQLMLTRAAGVVGQVSVSFSVVYRLPTQDPSSVGSTDVIDGAENQTTVIPGGSTVHPFQIPIKADSFLSLGATFLVTLLSVRLLDHATLLPPSSPRLGDRTAVSLEVTSGVANGEIGFERPNQRLFVNEPDGTTPTLFPLDITREGTSGDATIYWRIVSSPSYPVTPTQEDISAFSGSVFIASGIARTQIVLEILPDDLAETDETMIIQLYNVQPGSQILRQGDTEAVVTIRENDGPGGYFEFSPLTPGPFVISEGGDLVQVTILRRGGSLVTRSVRYFAAGDSMTSPEFYGLPQVVTFNPGETEKNISFVAAPDSIPELNEMFQLTLATFGNPPSDLGDLTTIQVTVLENDDPHGVFTFPEDPTIRHIDESKGTDIYSARFPVLRDAGVFGQANVSWAVITTGAALDISPLSGVLTYGDGISLQEIEITARADEIPENPETFQLTLTNPAGASRLGSVTTATLNINKNDDAIFFEDPIAKTVAEPGAVAFTVRRNGTAASIASVDYRTVAGSATDGLFDYATVAGTLQFGVGVQTQRVAVRILDDNTPEDDEYFTIQLYNPMGDVVVYGAPTATVTIAANDDPYGIFSFREPLTRVFASEGTSVFTEIQRARGNFGTVRVHWQIVYNGTSEPVPAGTEFEVVAGTVEFTDQQSLQRIQVTSRMDGVPEFAEYYELVLVNVTDGALSDTDPISVSLEISANDDPYGVLVFPSSSTERDIAEDYYPEDNATGRAVFTVERAQGSFGEVEVLWEVFSDSISGILPTVRDLIFLSEPNPSVSPQPSSGRLHTGTQAMFFDGGTNSYLRVPSQYQLPTADIVSGFSLSAWVRPDADVDGFVLSKLSTDGITVHYGLKLAARPGGMIMVHYRYSGSSFTNTVIDFALSSVDLADGLWHSIILTIDSLKATLYVDGSLIAERTMDQAQGDGAGELYVGALQPGTERYKGLLQDVRMYARKLQEREIVEIWTSPSKQDLTPISGKLTFDPGQRSADITMESLDDTEEEGNEVFTVMLLCSSGGGRIGRDDATALLTVLKSDNANGLFGFDGPCTPTSFDPESNEALQYTCSVIRSRGDEGVVTIPWEVRNLVTDEVASDDFVNATGGVVFPNGVRTQTIALAAIDDMQPELLETFSIILLPQLPLSDDGLIGTTDTSGASIDPDASANNLTIQANDFPYGLLQFATGPPPGTADPLIPPAAEMVRVRVREEEGMVRLLVVRAQGLLGEVQVEWRTIDGSALSAGKDPVDFVSGGGTLTFADQQRFLYITIAINDNNIAELDKTFQVQLSSPTQGAEVGIGSTVEVTIEGSDNAYGTFQFADVSLVVTVTEMDVGSSVTTLQVLRLGGALAEVTVDWVVTSDPNDPDANVTNDLVQSRGSVMFGVDEMTADINLEIASDELPELDESFYVQLRNASDGRLGDPSKLVATVTVAANDDPYGAFIFEANSRSVVVGEEFRNVSLTIQRQFGSEGVVQVVYSTLNAEETIPNMPAYISRARENVDFIPTRSSVIFSPGQLSSDVSVVLLDDTEPETAESLFVYIVSVSLLSSPQANPVIDSPRVGAEHIAEVYIQANDDANGVLQLSASTVRVSEESMQPFLNVTRVAGSFGTVTVTFQHIPGTAQQGLDYSVTSTNVIMYDGETHKAIPIEILNDRVPEVAESFQVVLLDQITGGAILGSPATCEVTIEPSDDPYGSFGFGFTNVQANEPEEGNSRQLSLSVIRNGGDIGVVAVIWEARINGVLAMDDVFPTGGTLYFLSFDVSQSFTLDILPDDIPEERETVILTLVNATGGGVIGNPPTATISIEANDNPHGIVEFTLANNIVQEVEGGDTVASIMVTRSAGTFGDLQVTFDTRPLDLVQEVTQNGETAMDYYQLPITGSQMGVSMTTIDVTGQSNPLLACAQECLRERACGSFTYRIFSGDAMCLWTVSTATDNVDATSGFRLFVKDLVKAQALYDSQAVPGLDYIPINSGSVRIPDGMASGYLNVTIRDDATPERDEIFNMRLASVTLVGPTPQPNNLPTLGTQRETRVTIASNDDANGVWRIYSNSPEAVNGQLVLVTETEGVSVSVELVVERQGGSIGDVSVSWQAVAGTATEGDDYSASGGTLNFASGQTRQVINIGIRDDMIPEIDETFSVELYNPTGGSELGLNGRVDVRILANDYVAGILKLSTLSYIVREGEGFNVTVERSSPGLGQVTVDWTISGVNGQVPTQSFQQTNGSLAFAPGQLLEAILLSVLSDDTPEVNEEFQVTLSNVQTMGISLTGAATLDPQGSTASVTIQASDEPHGVFSFAQGSEVVMVAEGNTTVQLFVDRKFGSIGRVRVFYEAKEGSLDPSLPALNLAQDGLDFIGGPNYLDFEEGQSVGEITVPINEDDIPELNEVFLVNLTAVQILDPATDTPPRLDSSGTLSQVTIEANDGTQGVVLFSGITGSLDTIEAERTLQLTVSRDRGTYGAVTVFVYSQPVDARKGSDYSFSDQVLSFGDGETTRTINVAIFDDDIAEADETFELILNNPTGGLQLGDPAKVTIRILASDDAFGIINFASPLTVTIQEPSDTDTSNSVAQLTLVRSRGTFGDVQVPFAVVDHSGSRGVIDLTPVDGFVTIAAGESTGVLHISATADDIPELEERFQVLLATPQGGAMLGDSNNATIIIQRNDAPYGSMQVFPTGSRQASLDVEEENGTVYFTVERSGGHIGTITVDWQAVPDTATAQAGEVLALATVQRIASQAIRSWCSYSVGQDVYLVLVSGAETGQLSSQIGSDGSSPGATSLLYRWQGEFVPVQSIETDGGVACTSYDIQGTTYLVIANHGSTGRYETMSRIYRVNQDGTLYVMQDVATKGATDATFFTIGSDVFLMLANGLTNAQLTVTESTVLLWTGVQFVAVSSLATTGAAGVEALSINGDQYLAVANSYDSGQASYEIKSVVYKWESGSFTEYQQLDTLGAVDVESFSVGTAMYLVFANSQNNEGASNVDSYVYRWNPSTSLFVIHQTIPTQGAQSVTTFLTSSGTTYLAIANAAGDSVVMEWEPFSAMFMDSLSLAPAYDVVPFTVTDYAGRDLVMLASANFGDGVSVLDSMILQIAGVTESSDFIPRSGRLTFQPEDTELTVAITILDDDRPEDDEYFRVVLSNPTGGAELGRQDAVMVDILSNDDAHGIIGFAQDSLNIQATEQATDTAVIFTLERQRGTSGVVVVAWVASGEHDPSDMRPTAGMVEFADGVSTAAIVITVTADSFPELDETSTIQLTSIVNPGTTHPGRGAMISDTDSTALLTVLANDSPHGVFAWTLNSLFSVVNEPEGSQPSASVVLHILREQGSLGAVNVRYKTSRAAEMPELKQAEPNRDFVSQDNYVRMEDGVTSASLTIAILPDTDSEGPETFLVNLTSVDLVTGTPVGGAAPSIKNDQDVAEITITQNDNANGILQLNASKNSAGDVEVYEGSGTSGVLSLPVSRTAGAFGRVGVNWLATTVSASTADFSPLSGNVTFIEGQREAFIEIAIIDDTIYENDERFTVSLHNPSGGAVLGAETSVIIKILKNDSPKGLFGFLYTQETVMESLSPSDPSGEVTLIIERSQGTQGIVEVDWALEPLGRMDLSPAQGSLTFQEGATRRTITLRAVEDTVLEGEERYTVTIQSVTDDAEISPVFGTTTIVIQPDAGSAGLIAVLPQSRYVLIGEPTTTHDGTATLHLTRGAGIFSQVTVNWQLSPRDGSTFRQTSGTLVFEDLQQNATIMLQTIDDSIPETKQTYILQLSSITGGAAIDPDSQANQATIIVVASDNPHGVFEFSGLPEVVVSEDLPQVSLDVVRNAGISGAVKVTYTTKQISAQPGEDYVEDSGDLIFSEGVDVNTIKISLVPDNLPEGPESFLVNLTSIELLQPVNNDYTLRGGLSLDMPPVIGSFSEKTVTIAANDNAQGIIEFAQSNVFEFSEGVGTAVIPVVRTAGTFGLVQVSYTSRNLTATPGGVDYSLTDGAVSFLDGQSQGSISVTIIDDQLKEFAEVFEITLTETLGGAVLGRNRTATVVISKSDGPDGLIGFSLNQLERILPNPENNRDMEFTIELSGGIDQYLTGAEVRWRILGPNSQTLPPDTSDISTSGGQLQGSVTFDPGQRGAKSFTLRVKPYPGPEVEETFTVEIYQVVGAGEISEDAGRATLKILKHGDPNGVVRFYGESINPRSFEEPGDGGSLKVAFPLRRREGVVGDINVHWEARDATGQVASDVSPPNGTLRIPDGVANTQILLNILPDQIPELQERFQLVLVSVDGGAEIDPQFNTSTFYIQPNDNPHGVFSVHQENQTVGVNANMKRYLRIYVTRGAGTEGDVSVTFDLKYNDGITGAYVPSSSSVVCRSGNAFCTKDIPLLNNDMFLERDTSFNVTLTSLSYLGPVEVTIPPVMLPGAKSALVVVPQEAANSLVGFKMDATTVDDISYRTVLTIERIGSYGTIDVLWQAGYPSDELPQGYLQGAVSQGSGQLNMGSGVSTITLPIVLNPSGNPSELFAAHLTSALTSAEGGARLRGGYTTAPIEPYGVVGFTQGSRGVTVSEGSGELSLTVERQLGTLGSIRVTYQTHAASAVAGEDYVAITSGALTMATRAKTANILVTILEEQAPELAKVFYVNITSVARLPIDGTQGTSPRLSSRYPVSEVTIEGSNDPYGVLSMDPDVIEIAESEATCKHVTLNIQRSGGSHGEVSIRVRTIGGGEPWQSSVAQRPSDTTNTIENALANTQDRPHATAGQDYEQVDVAITFRDGETEKSFQVEVCDDGVAEPAELFFVYLSEPTGGARVAQGQPDGGLKGFTHFTIVGSDNFNGVIGFAEESRFVTVDEDVTPSITLTLDRGQAFFGEVTVEWRATYSAIGDITNDADLYNQLEQAQGMVTCPADQRLCTFDITLRQDEEPEFASWFLVELVGVGQGASLDQAQRLANITTLDSDYPYGLLQFTTDTRFQSVHSNTKRVSLRVERIGGSTKDSAVSWGTFQLDSPIKLAGLTAYPAIPDTDYVATSGVLDFSSGIRRIPLDVVLLPETPASSAEYPKLLQVRLMQATNGAGIHADYGTASITLVEDERTADIWDNRYSALIGLNNDNIYNILLDMAEHVKAQLTEEQLAVVVDTIGMVVAEGGRRKLPSNLLTQLMDIYCTLMNPDRQDTRGAYQLAESFSTFAFILVTDLPCETQDPQTLSCDHAVVETGRWSRGRINGHNFQGKDRNSFTMPTNLLDTSASSSCEDIHFIEYSSQQWFYGANEASTLNNQVLSVAIKGAEQNFTRLSTPVTYRIYTDNARVTPRGASCVIFNGPTERWRPDSCQILTQQGAYVECSCTHLSDYAAQGETDNLVGYNVYIYVSCFICIAGLVCAIIAHNVCSVYSMFSAKLLIHMCFAAMSLQVVFVTSAYVSSYISTASCAVLGVLIHFFFLAQFTWMLVQAFNLWKVFVINDEHTERYYILFFVIGWCLPVVAIVIYVVITYAVFDWPFLLDTSIADPSSPAAMYGDVHLNGDICFMPNGYAALASAVGPAILCLFGVATVFTNAYQVKPQWKRYDDIYMGSYNTTEVQLLLVFWAIIFLTCLFGGLHMAYSYLWLLIVFVIFNIVQGLYAFVVYTILRNQICRPRKGNYSLNPSGFDNSVMLLDNSQYVGNGLMAAGSEKGSRVLLTKAEQPPGVTIIGNHDEWDTQSLGRQSQHSQHSHHSQHSKTNQSQPSRPGSVASRGGGGGNRSRPGSIQNNLYAPAPFQDVPAPLPPTHHHDDDTDSQDFDDLIFALKTGGAYVRGEEEGESRSRPSSRVSSNWQDDSQMGEMMDMTGDATQDHYEMRRIQIADTHL
ncbi:adhesion G-protein coupled receptor V1-like isoform X2 [Patiria miniata]|uniref:Staphylococcus aureus surface protein A n=1 Tax=Patiria miniata TaxID=46514 RepID=A0A914BKQ2_PATMI|nr:adhesion G-protein coupled receptor V1-like isoform X2 [Patiria miniata]